MKRLLVLVLLTSCYLGIGQGVNWVSVEQAQALNKENPRPFIVDVYTNWCGWCKKMEATTYRDPQIVSYINSNFYAIKYNAETKDSIFFNGKLYTNRGGHSRSINDLTNVFVNGRKSYPSTYFCTSGFARPMTVPGYLKPEDLAPMLSFYADKAYAGTNINQYMDDFKSAFTPKDLEEKKVEVESAPEKGKKKRKKKEESVDSNEKRKSILVLTDLTKPASKVFMNEILIDSMIQVQLDSTFDVSSIDVYTKDTVDFNGQRLLPTQGKHQVEHYFLSNMKQKVYPSLVFLTGDKELITIVPQYMDRAFFSTVVEYFSGELYKKGGVTFQEFYQNKAKK